MKVEKWSLPFPLVLVNCLKKWHFMLLGEVTFLAPNKSMFCACC